MREKEILEGIRDVVREFIDSNLEVGTDTAILHDMQLDSLALITLIAELENRFRICFEEGHEQELQTIGDVVEAIDRRIAAREMEEQGAHG